MKRMMSEDLKYRMSPRACRQRTGGYLTAVLAVNLLAAGLLAAGCARENEEPGDNSGDVAVPIEISAVSVANTVQTSTRTAGFTPMEEEGTEICVIGAGVMQRIYKYNGSKWEKKDYPVMVNLTNNTVLAGYPATEVKSATYVMSAKGYSKTKDALASGPRTVDYRNPVVAFEMEHIYARLTIQVVKSNKHNAAHILYLPKLKLLTCTGLYSGGTFNLKEKECSDLTAGTLRSYGNDMEIPSEGSAEITPEADYLLPPGAAADLTIELTWDTEEIKPQKVTIPREKYTPKAGEWMTIQVCVHPLYLTPDVNITLEQWPDPSVKNGTMPEPEPID